MDRERTFRYSPAQSRGVREKLCGIGVQSEIVADFKIAYGPSFLFHECRLAREPCIAQNTVN